MPRATRQLLDTAALARLLGISVNAVHLRRRRDLLPKAIKIGRRLYWRRSTVERWLDQALEPNSTGGNK